MSVLLFVLSLLGHAAAWVWGLAPVPITLVLVAMACGFAAALLYPKGGVSPLRCAVRVVPWALGHDPELPDGGLPAPVAARSALGSDVDLTDDTAELAPVVDLDAHRDRYRATA